MNKYLKENYLAPMVEFVELGLNCIIAASGGDGTVTGPGEEIPS